MNLLICSIFFALQATDLCFDSFVVKNDVNACAYISPFDTLRLQLLEISRGHKHEPVSIKINEETSALQVYPSKFTRRHSLSTRSKASSFSLIERVMHLKNILVVAKKKKQQEDVLFNWFHISLTPLYAFKNFFGFQIFSIFHLEKKKKDQSSYLLKCFQKLNTSFRSMCHQKTQNLAICSTHFLKLKYFIKWLWTGNPLDLHIRLKHTLKLKEDPILYKNRIIVGFHFPHHMDHQYDFAAYDAGARILAYSSSIKNVRAPQRPGYDSYLLAPCTKPIWFVMAFNTQVYIKSIGLVSQEFFSSAFRTIEIFGSDIYPTRHWRLLAVLRAHYDRPKELFNLKSICEKFTSSDCWVKYIRFKVVDYYQIEDYNHCTLNRFQVFGLDVLESLNNKLTHTQDAPYAPMFTDTVEAPTLRSSISNNRNHIPSSSEDISTVHSPRKELTHRPRVSSSISHSDLFLYNLISLSNPKRMKNAPLNRLPFLQKNMMIQVPSQNNLYSCYVTHDAMYHEKTQHTDRLSNVAHSLHHHVLNNSFVETNVLTKEQSAFTVQGFSKRQSMIQKIFVKNMQNKRPSELSCSSHEHKLHQNSYRPSAKRSKEKVEHIPPTPPFLLRLVDRLTALESTSKHLTNTTSHLLQEYNSAFDQLVVLRNQMETSLKMPNLSNLESFFIINPEKNTSKEFLGLFAFLFFNILNDFLTGLNVSNSSLQKAFQAYQGHHQKSWNSLLLNPAVVISSPLNHQHSICWKSRFPATQFQRLSLCGKLFQLVYLLSKRCVTILFQWWMFFYSFLQKRQFISYDTINFCREMRRSSVSCTSPSNVVTMDNTSVYHKFEAQTICYTAHGQPFQTTSFDSQPVHPFAYVDALFCEGYFLLKYLALSTVIKIVLIGSSSISLFFGQLYSNLFKPCFNCFLNPHLVSMLYTLMEFFIFILKQITLDRVVFVTVFFWLLRSLKTQRRPRHKRNYNSFVKAPRSPPYGYVLKRLKKLRRKVPANTSHKLHATVHVSLNHPSINLK